MQKRVAGLLCLWACLQCVHADAKETLRFAVGEWAPYTASAPPGGFLETVVAEAFKLEGIEVQYDYFPWKRSYVAAEKGEYDGTFPWSRTEWRERDFVIHTVALLQDEGVYFHLKSVPFDWNTLQDLKNYRVGATIGYKQERIYKSMGIEADLVSSEDLNFRKILAGRIDVYQTSRNVGYATLRKIFTPQEAAQFTHHPRVAEVTDYFILFSAGRPQARQWAERFDAGLRKLKASGRYRRIVLDHAARSGAP